MTTIVRSVGRPSKIGKAIEVFLVAVSEGIQASQIRQRMVATGASINSHKVTIKKNPDSGEHEASDYYTFLIKDQGRAKGTFPPVNVIIKWIRDRGIRAANMSINQLAFLIGRKIKNIGTEITTGRKGIDTNRIVGEHNQEFAEAVGDEMAKQVSATILKSFARIPGVKIQTTART